MINITRMSHIGDTHWSLKRLAEKELGGERILAELRLDPPDVNLHCGDNYDSSIQMGDPAALSSVCFTSEMRDIGPLLMIQGNWSHERQSSQILSFTKGRYAFHRSMKPEVVLFYGRDEEFSVFPMGIEVELQMKDRCPKAVFFTLPYPSSAFLAERARLNPEDMKKAVSDAITAIIQGFSAVAVPVGVPKVLLFHGTIAGAKYTETSTEIGMDINLSPFDIGRCNFHATFAAHIHMRQTIETSSGPCFYPGGLACTSYNDDPHKGAWIHEFTTGEHGVALSSRHFDVGATPMKSIDVDFSDPFFEPPAVGVCDLQIKVRMLETDRERLKAMDWKQAFPDAVSIQIVPTVEQIGSVRCAEVRSAKSLRQKVLAWDENLKAKGEPSTITDPVLNKADLLETCDAAAILAMDIGG